MVGTWTGWSTAPWDSPVAQISVTFTAAGTYSSTYLGPAEPLAHSSLCFGVDVPGTFLGFQITSSETPDGGVGAAGTLDYSYAPGLQVAPLDEVLMCQNGGQLQFGTWDTWFEDNSFSPETIGPCAVVLLRSP